MDDQRDDRRPSAVSEAADAAYSHGERGTPATGPPSADLPASLGERLELRIRIAELTAVIDVIATALRDARAAGLKVTERHERLVADGKAAAGLLRTIARRLE